MITYNELKKHYVKAGAYLRRVDASPTKPSPLYDVHDLMLLLEQQQACIQSLHDELSELYGNTGLDSENIDAALLSAKDMLK